MKTLLLALVLALPLAGQSVVSGPGDWAWETVLAHVSSCEPEWRVTFTVNGKEIAIPLKDRETARELAKELRSASFGVVKVWKEETDCSDTAATFDLGEGLILGSMSSGTHIHDEGCGHD